MDLGIAIKKVREHSGLTQRSFAANLFITQSYLSLIENNQKTPSMEIIERISELCETPVPVLFWQGITEGDVTREQWNSFKMLKPVIDGMINSVFFE